MKLTIFLWLTIAAFAVMVICAVFWISGRKKKENVKKRSSIFKWSLLIFVFLAVVSFKLLVQTIETNQKAEAVEAEKNRKAVEKSNERIDPAASQQNPKEYIGTTVASLVQEVTQESDKKWQSNYWEPMKRLKNESDAKNLTKSVKELSIWINTEIRKVDSLPIPDSLNEQQKQIIVKLKSELIQALNTQNAAANKVHVLTDTQAITNTDVTDLLKKSSGHLQEAANLHNKLAGQ